jgi:hypothetical protein
MNLRLQDIYTRRAEFHSPHGYFIVNLTGTLTSDKERTPGFAEGSWRIYTRRLCLSRRQVRGTSDKPNITQKKGIENINPLNSHFKELHK